MMCLLRTFSFKHLYGLSGHNCRNSMLINQLRVSISAQKDTKIIKWSYNTRKFDAINKKNGKGNFCLRTVFKTHLVGVVIALPLFLHLHLDYIKYSCMHIDWKISNCQRRSFKFYQQITEIREKNRSLKQ